MNADLQQKLVDWAGEPLHSTVAIGGGCIADARRVQWQSGRQAFLKSGSAGPGMFVQEANGLRELAKARAIRVPEVFLAENDFILMKYIAPGRPKSGFFAHFGRAFAQQHRFTAEAFGFYEDNWIGATPQRNNPSATAIKSWPEFYRQYRLQFQIDLAHQKRLASPALLRDFDKLTPRLDDLLSGSEEKPSLLHGDLWSGNFLSDEQGEPVIIDPAVYYGHREADLAMTKLFGGFSADFYAAYQESWPLSAGYLEREGLYLLYHVLNHLNLFGSSYHGQAHQLIRQYL